jgi:hypothetical protein
MEDKFKLRKEVIETLPESMKVDVPNPNDVWQILNTLSNESLNNRINEKDSNVLSYKSLHQCVKITFEDLIYRDRFFNYYNKKKLIRKLFRILNRIIPGNYYVNVHLEMLPYEEDYYFETKLTKKTLDKTYKVINRYAKALHDNYKNNMRRAKEDLQELMYGK